MATILGIWQCVLWSWDLYRITVELEDGFRAFMHPVFSPSARSRTRPSVLEYSIFIDLRFLAFMCDEIDESAVDRVPLASPGQTLY
jgi:hypothetical protein